MKKSIFGLSENVAGLLSYAGFFFSGIVVLILEKDNKFVRFHALQSTIWFLFLSIAAWFVVPFIGALPLICLAEGLLAWFLNLLSGVSWLYLMFTAFTGKEFRIPVIGDVVWAQINK